MPRIRVVVAEPHKAAEICEIDDSLEAMQKLVGGYIEMLPIAWSVGSGRIVVNEEGRLVGLPMNREWPKGQVLLGTIFVAGSDADGQFASLSEADADEVRRLLDGAKVGN